MNIKIEILRQENRELLAVGFTLLGTIVFMMFSFIVLSFMILPPPHITCSTFQTQAQAISYVVRHPEYAGKLDRDGRSGPCQNLN